MFKYLWNIVNNTFFGLVFGIGLTLLIFFLQRQEIKIAYTVLDSNVIAKDGVDKNIIILFKNDTIPNLNLVEFAFWNNGTLYIDKKSISETAPLKISTHMPVRILDCRIVKKSRANLNFHMTNNTIPNNSEIILKIKGDDGLERFDGAKIQILYSGTTNAEWKIDGRIKGNLNSFKEYDAHKLEKYRKKTLWHLLLYFTGIIIPLLLIFYFLKALKEKKVHEEKISDIQIMTVALSVFPIICIIKVGQYMFYNGVLEWLL